VSARWLDLFRRRARASALCVLGILLCFGCERPTARLLQIDSVQRDDEGRVLAVAGHGFPASHTGRAELTGTLHRPGEGPRALSLELGCHALSEELLRIDLSAASEQGLSGLFEGKVEVRFSSSAGDSDVMGAISYVRLRLEEPSERDPAATLGLLRRARAFHRSLGALELEATPRGLVLGNLSENSPLLRAGASPGDRIERIDGAPVERVVDLLPRDEHSGHVLELVQRRGGHKLRLSITGAATTTPQRADLALVAFVMAALVSLLFEPRTAAPSRPADPWLRYGAPALACLSFVCCTGFGRELDLGLFVGIPGLLAMISLAGAFARRRLTSRRALEHVVQLSAIGLALTGLTMISGNLTVSWFGELEMASPSRWPLLSAPPAWLALWVVAGAFPSDVRNRPLATLIAWGRLSVLIAVVILSAGAGNLPNAVSPLPAAYVGGALLIVGKAWLLQQLTNHLTWHASSALLAALGLVAPILSWLFMLWPASAELTLPMGALVLGFWLVHGLRSSLGAHTRKRTRDPALAPFL